MTKNTAIGLVSPTSSAKIPASSTLAMESIGCISKTVTQKTSGSFKEDAIMGAMPVQAMLQTQTTVETTTKVLSAPDHAVAMRSIETATEKAHAERILAIKASVLQPDPLLDFPY